MRTVNTEDREILQLIRNEQTREKGFLLLVNKYQQKLYYHLRRLLNNHQDTDDALQNTFIKAWKGLPKFRSESQLYTWLYRIATNEGLSLMKTNKRKKSVSLDEAEKDFFSDRQYEPGPGGEEISNKLNEAVRNLPKKQQLVFNMKYFDEMKYEEMSEVLETSVGALKASYHHAVKKIEIELKKE